MSHWLIFLTHRNSITIVANKKDDSRNLIKQNHCKPPSPLAATAIVTQTIASKKTATVGSIRFASRNSTAVVWHNSATPLLRRVLHQVHPDRNHNGALACLSLKYDDFCFILERDIQIKVEDFGLRWRENKKSRKKCRCRITSLVTVSDIR